MTAEWATWRAHQVGYASLNDMLDDYTADTTDGWALDALRDNALRGFGWGALPDSNLD